MFIGHIRIPEELSHDSRRERLLRRTPDARIETYERSYEFRTRTLTNSRKQLSAITICYGAVPPLAVRSLDGGGFTSACHTARQHTTASTHTYDFYYWQGCTNIQLKCMHDVCMCVLNACCVHYMHLIYYIQYSIELYNIHIYFTVPGAARTININTNTVPGIIRNVSYRTAHGNFVLQLSMCLCPFCECSEYFYIYLKPPPLPLPLPHGDLPVRLGGFLGFGCG